MPKLHGQQWLAEQLGVSRQRVGELVAEKRIPRKQDYTDADAESAKKMLADARTRNNATAGDIEASGDEAAIQALSRNPERIARIKLIIERTAKIRLERELLAGGYLKREDIEKQQVGKVYALRAKLQELPLRASLIAGKTEAECERILTDWIKEICDYFASSQ